jgi:hypothetical protein
MKLPTIYQIRDATLEKAPKFFSKQNLKFAGQTMRDFEVRLGKSGAVYILAPLRMEGRTIGTSFRRFTGDDLDAVAAPEPVRNSMGSLRAWVEDEG